MTGDNVNPAPSGNGGDTGMAAEVTAVSAPLAVVTPAPAPLAATPEPFPYSTPAPWKPDPKRKVIILGFASSSRHLAPTGDESFEVWSLNQAYSFCPKWARWFDMHQRQALDRQGEHLKWLQAQPAPDAATARGSLYMQDRHPDIPASVRFPREEINAWLEQLGGRKVGYFARDYYTSSISQMLALAMMEGFGEIHIYGVDLLQDEEYYYQRAGAEYLIGLARGLGFAVYLPPQCALCQANYTYGYSELAESGSKQVLQVSEYFSGKGKEALDTMHRAAAEANLCDGAVQFGAILRQWINELAPGESPAKVELLKRMDAKLAELTKRFQGAKDGANQAKGQGEAFETGSIWLKHVARGGVLQA